MRFSMNADKSRPSHHRDQNAATSAVARALASDARGHSLGVDARIDGGRFFLAMSLTGSADAQQRSSGGEHA